MDLFVWAESSFTSDSAFHQANAFEHLESGSIGLKYEPVYTGLESSLKKDIGLK